MLLNIRGARAEHNIDDLPVDVNATVEELRRLVAGRLHVEDPSRVRMIYSGRLLDNAQPVSFYNIQDGRAIHIVVASPDAPHTTAASNNNNNNTSAMPAGNAHSFTFSVDSAQGMPNFAQMMPQAATVLSSAAPLLSTFFGSGFPQAPAPTFAAPTDLAEGGGLAGSPSVASTANANAMPGFPTSAQTASSNTGTAANTASATTTNTNATTTTTTTAGALPSAAPGPNVSRGIPLARTMPTHTMGTTNITMVSATPAQPATPALAGVYVHVHCDVNELDALPERLARLQQRMSVPNVVFQAHAQGQRVPGAPVPAAAAPTHDNESNERTTGTRDEVLHRWFAALPRSVAGTPLFMPTLLSAAGERIGVAGVPALMMGNWMPVAQQRPVLLVTLQTYRQRFVPDGLSMSDIATREGWRVYEQIWSQDAVRQLIAQEARPEATEVDPSTGRTRLQSEFLSYLRSIHCRMIDLVVLGTAVNDMQWAARLRVLLVRLVGVAFHRSGQWFTNGSTALTRILLQAMEVFILQSATASNTGNASPASPAASLAAMMPLLRTSLPPLWQSWVAEYERPGVRHESDDDVFNFRYFPEAGSSVNTSGSSPAAAATPPIQASASDLLDAAFNEVAGGSEPAPMNAHSEVESLEAAINAWADAAAAPHEVVALLNQMAIPPPDE